MPKKIIIIVLLAGAILAAVSLAVCSSEKKSNNELFRQVELFSNAVGIIQSDYVEEPDPKELIYGALDGMLASLDAHSQFMDPEAYNDLKSETEGKFGGLGIEITIKDGLLTVVTPIEDTPAWDAGIKANDRIVKINNELTRDLKLSEAVKKLRGKPQDPVTITIFRESENKILEFKIVRDIIKIKDIKDARIIQDKIGYIRLAEFRETTPRDFKSALENLKSQGMDALILDLRNNPGGLLETAVDITQVFLPEGELVISTKGRKQEQDIRFVAKERKPILDIPMVVLINEGSASGSEIVAAALQDYKRAIILGTKSFGKGSVQSVIPLGDGSALRLTTSKYFTPSGREINSDGVKPDITIGQDIALTGEPGDLLRKSEDIFKQVESGDKNEVPGGKIAGYKKDNQLMRAIDALRAVRVYGKHG